MAEEVSNTGQAFGARDFSTVDDIISIIDSKKEDAPEQSEESKIADSMDQGQEFGVGREKNKFSSNNDELQDEKDSETASEDQSEGTQVEQSVSSEDTQVDKPDAEESKEAKDSQSDDSKESNETDNEVDDSLDLKDDEEIVIELDDGQEFPMEQIVEEWTNNQNWQKSNTEKAQQLADEKRVFEDSVKNFRLEEIQEALKNEELQEALDDWFEDKEKNPFRKAVLPDTIETEEQQENQDPSVSEDRMMLTVEKEIFELQKKDESLNDEGKLNSLIDFAMKNDVKLETAHRLMQFDSIQSEFDEVKKELKDRNDELSKLKKQAQKSVPTELPAGKGAVKEDYSGSAGTWNGAEDRVLAKLGLK